MDHKPTLNCFEGKFNCKDKIYTRITFIFITLKLIHFQSYFKKKKDETKQHHIYAAINYFNGVDNQIEKLILAIVLFYLLCMYG